MADDTEIVCKFFKEGRCCFGDRCRNSHPVNEGSTTPLKLPETRKTVTEVKNNVSKKMPPMKTARDVIRRIQWDEDLPKEHFIIGYLDRFVGVIEQPFGAFDWSSDLASVDNETVLAIPQHRIQYFKYRHRKVWDKSERLDLIFGSTSLSSKDKTIVELLRSIDEELIFQEDTFTVIPIENGEPDFSDLKPTHFLTFKIEDPELVTTFVETMSELLVTDSVVPQVNSKLYHVTLGLLCLENVSQVSHCVNLMSFIGIDFFAGAPQFVQFSGIGSYGERVLYARVTEDCSLNVMVSNLLYFLKSQGVCVQERPVEFHMTLLKGNNFMASIDHDKLAALGDRDVGQQPLTEIHLCAIREPPVDDGFYRIISSIEMTKIPD